MPVAAINAVGFAFADYDQVWNAMDGTLGAHVRAALAKVRLHTFEKMWDNGFRQMTSGAKPIETAKDMDGLKIRVPVSPLSISMFKGARRIADQPAVQRGLFGAADQDRRRAGESAADHPGRPSSSRCRSTVAISNHIWDGFWFIANGRAWEALPADLQDDRRQCDQRCGPETA